MPLLGSQRCPLLGLCTGGPHAFSHAVPTLGVCFLPAQSLSVNSCAPFRVQPHSAPPSWHLPRTVSYSPAVSQGSLLLAGPSQSHVERSWVQHSLCHPHGREEKRKRAVNKCRTLSSKNSVSLSYLQDRECLEGRNLPWGLVCVSPCPAQFSPHTGQSINI